VFKGESEHPEPSHHLQGKKRRIWGKGKGPLRKPLKETIETQVEKELGG